MVHTIQDMLTVNWQFTKPWMQWQLFVGDHVSSDKFEPPRSSRCWIKPEGGLWTSTWLGDEQGSAWVQWCLSEHFRVPDDNRWNCTLLLPDPTANVFVIDSHEDLERLLDIGMCEVPYGNHQYPDFDVLAEHYDGIHLTSRGQWATRYTQPANLYGWDVECTLWFRWAFAGTVPIGKMDFGEPSSF